MENNSIFFQCRVLNTEDPMMLGRIRGVRLIDNYDDILKSITSPPWNEEKDIWTSRDPFIFNALLPYFVYSVPKVDELVQVIYVNKDFQYQNQYYVQNTFSSPTATFKEFYFGGNKFTGTGMQIKNPKPLKNQDGTFTDQSVHKGVFPQPGDNALLGRGSADVIVKQDEVLVRAGKFKGEQLQPNVIPVANQQRGFLQLSKFQSVLQNLEPKVYYELQENVLLTKYLIEWAIINPENTQDKFTGSVYLYQLKPDVSVNSKNISVDSVIPENLKKLVATENFSQLSKIQVIKFINDFIKTCNETDTTRSGVKLFSDNSATNKFPIYYRPNTIMYSKLNPSTPLGSGATSTEISNISDIYKGVKLNPALIGGYGLIYAKGKVGIPKNAVKRVAKQQKYINQESSYGALGSDTLFLVSHNSQIPGKGKINFDDTLYGITPEKFANEFLPKTSSMVRGEELLELINLIVRFLVTHTHAYPGLPPVPVTQDGSNTQAILTELQNAVNKILSKNIRLN
jgi:hypothetical protein|tara:strand:+ start:5276 stop:6811 length:1536 start_codon:yes stop_codon:yes gene_type:complete